MHKDNRFLNLNLYINEIQILTIITILQFRILQGNMGLN